LLIYRSVNSNAGEIFEIDQASWNNFMYVGCYARDITNYLKQREVNTIFIIILNVTTIAQCINSLFPRITLLLLIILVINPN